MSNWTGPTCLVQFDISDLRCRIRPISRWFYLTLHPTRVTSLPSARLKMRGFWTATDLPSWGIHLNMIKQPALVCLLFVTSLVSSIAEAASHDRILHKIEKT